MISGGQSDHDGDGRDHRPFRPRPARPDAARSAPSAAEERSPGWSREAVDEFIRLRLVERHGRHDPDAVATHLEKSTTTYRSAVLLANSADFDNAASLAHKSAHHAVDALLAHRACRTHMDVRDRHRGHVNYFEAELAASGRIRADRAAALAKKWQSALDVRNKETYRAFAVTDPKPEIDTARSVRRYCYQIMGREPPDDPKYP